MSTPLRIGLDLSCAADTPLTGIGYAAAYQINALAAGFPDLSLRALAAGGRDARRTFETEMPRFDRLNVLPRARLAKYYAWTRLEWPPMEWFCGAMDIAHNLCHALPATKRAVRIVTVHDLSVFRHPECHTERTVQVQSTLLKQAVRGAEHLIAVSDFTKRELVDVLGANPSNVTVVPNGVNVEDFAEPINDAALRALKERLGIRDRYFIHLGTIEPRKNIPRLIEAYAQLRETRGPCPQLLLVGTPAWGAEPSLEAIARHTKNGGIVRAGYLPRAEALLLLRGAMACVYPSLYEGFGLPVLEAMAAKTPVIASAASAIPEVAGDTALLVDPNDVDALSDAMRAVIDDPDAARARSDDASVRAQAFSWARSAGMLHDLYFRLAGST